MPHLPGTGPTGFTPPIFHPQIPPDWLGPPWLNAASLPVLPHRPSTAAANDRSVYLGLFFFGFFFVATKKKKITIENHNTTSNHLSYPCWIWLMWLMMIMKTITRGVGRKWVKKKPTGKSRTSTVSSVENLRPLRPEGSYLPFKKGRFLTLDPRGFRYHKWPLNGTATYQVDRCWGQIIFLPSLWN